MDETSKRGKGRGRGRGRGRGQRKQPVKAHREPMETTVPEQQLENEIDESKPPLAKVEEKENEIIIQAPPTS